MIALLDSLNDTTQARKENITLPFGDVNVDYQNKILYFDLIDCSFTSLVFGVLCDILVWTADALCLPFIWWHRKSENLEISGRSGVLCSCCC